MPRRFNRRQILALGAAAASVVALGSYVGSARGQGSGRISSYRGRTIRVERRRGRPELFIDGEHIITVDSNGAYRAAEFMFSPSPTLDELAKNMIDYEIALRGR